MVLERGFAALAFALGGSSCTPGIEPGAIPPGGTATPDDPTPEDSADPGSQDESGSDGDTGSVDSGGPPETNPKDLVPTAGATLVAEDCGLSAVQAAVEAAHRDDIVEVPAGTCTWTGVLTLEKGIRLMGAGIGSTVIVSAATDYLVRYTPSYESDEYVRVSGFTFDLDATGGGIDLGTWYKVAPFQIQTLARIDHNRFWNQPDIGYQAIFNRGTVRGVVDANVFDSVAYPTRADPGVGGSSWWDSFEGIVYGERTNNLYYEDNVFNDVSIGVVSDCQWSGRYAFRYNTIRVTNPNGAWPIFDIHGNQGGGAAGGMYGCFGGEMYGNRIDGGGNGVRLLHHRGGKAILFFNEVERTSGADIEVMEEYADDENPTSNEEPQHVSDSFYWNNRAGGEQIGAWINAHCSQCLENGLIEDVHFHQEKSSFDGSSGVGMGKLEDRPAACMQGVAYWATNQDSSSLDAFVGAEPDTPIAGTLYKCTARDVWTAYFTPLAYPHPLREE
jgi:hypothetical protein